MLFYDFEVFEHDWLVVILDMDAQKEHVIVNDEQQMRDFYENHVDDIWVGFNSRGYDQYILKSIILGLNPKQCNDWIIVKERAGWDFSSAFNKIPLNNYDVMQGIDRGLKVFEGFMGNDIRESSVPFDIKRKLTKEELEETIRYCRHDVEQTVEVFIKRQSDFEAQMQLLKMFKLPLSYISKTKVRLAATILDAKKRTYNDEFEISFPNTMKIDKYSEVVWWYEERKNRNYDKSLHIDVAGVPHDFAWGGVHGAREKYYGEGLFLMMDVASLYPSLMIIYGLLSRSCNPVKFKDIVDTRLKYKHEKNPLQAPLKIVINGTYGAMKDKTNPLYDPLMANNVCIFGQLLLLDLIEHLEDYCELIQSNTDGILIKMPAGYDEDEWYSLIDDIAYEWEKRTGLVLEFDEYRKVYQKDVNNYVIVDADGHMKSKGAYVKALSDLDYDLAIVNKAVVDFMVHGISVRKTIMECDNLRDFQMVKKISSKYECILHGVTYEPVRSVKTGKLTKKTQMDLSEATRLNEKTIRVFASKNPDGGLVKLHATTNKYAKIENTPENCFIFNADVNNYPVPSILDKEWYIQLAYKRLKDFGVV